MQPNFIGGSDLGLVLDKKPWLLHDKAFQTLENAYVYRERVVERNGVKKLGRLRRILTTASIGNYSTINGTNTLNIFTGLGVAATEPNAQIESGATTNISIAFGAPISQTLSNTSGTSTLTITGAGPITAASINYATGVLTITGNAATGPAAATFTGAYYPGLPVMGERTREIIGTNAEQTIFFDTKYAYIYSSGFQEWITGTTWNATDADFIWTTNYRGANPQDKLFFATNNINDASNPIRYTDGATWTIFAPAIDGTNFLFQALLLIPYYGRLIALNTTEGATRGTSVNIFNRARYSQIGSPVASDAWRSDQFGKGGFVDAPTNEAIIGVDFFQNTLIVQFERSKWQLRYVGEYGLPFIWERVSSDFGCDGSYSTVLFDEGVLAVGDRAITFDTSVKAKRIDEQIPDIVFTMRNAQSGTQRVYAARDFKNELVYWCYSDSNLQRKFPNKVLVYNYRNSSYAVFRDNITCFGTFQPTTAITWDSTDILWDNMDVYWDDAITQSLFPFIISGNAQGYVHYYNYLNSMDEPSLSISAVANGSSTVQLTVPNHNLETGEIIYLTGLTYSNSPSNTLNDTIYQVLYIDDNTIGLLLWNGNNYAYVTDTVGTYIGFGEVTILPKMKIQTKDFNPYVSQGNQLKLIYIDFLVDTTPSSAISVELYINTSPAGKANILIGNQEMETYAASPFYFPVSNISWHRFIASATGQFVNVLITYDDTLMNTLATHQQSFTLNGMILYTRLGGKNVF